MEKTKPEKKKPEIPELERPVETVAAEAAEEARGGATFRGGVSVAGGDVNRGGIPDIVGVINHEEQY